MNRAGFTTIEVIIASALIIALVTAGGVGMRQMNILSQVATSRTASTEMRTRVIEALSNSGTCAQNLGFPVLPNPLTPLPVPRVPIAQINDGPIVLLKTGLAALGDPLNKIQNDGVRYEMNLTFSNPTKFTPFPPGLGRPAATIRYHGRLEITTIRDLLSRMTNPNTNVTSKVTDLYGRIPLSMEFNQITRRLVSCTLHTDDMDELLVGGIHTVRQCMQSDGHPVQTTAGLICRLPVETRNVKGYAGAIPNCNTLGGGVFPPWANAAPAPNYNTTVPIFIEGRKCKNGTVSDETGWHSMSRTAVEVTTIRVKKGTGTGLSAFLGGTAFTMIVVVSIIPVLGTIIGAVVALVAFIISIFKKCKSENFTFYAQVNGVGCI